MASTILYFCRKIKHRLPREEMEGTVSLGFECDFAQSLLEKKKKQYLHNVA
jgi:hypothetical protein